MISFKYIYLFAHNDEYLCEVKVLGLPDTTSKNKKFHWLLIDQNKNINKLTFVSMNENKREFKEGKLEINDIYATFNDTTYKMAESNEKLEESIKKFITKTLD